MLPTLKEETSIVLSEVPHEKIEKIPEVRRSQSSRQLYGVPGERKKPPRSPYYKRRVDFPDLRPKEASPLVKKLKRRTT